MDDDVQPGFYKIPQQLTKLGTVACLQLVGRRQALLSYNFHNA